MVKTMSLPTVEEILDWADVSESTVWEFKSAKGGLPGSLWETYSAMANTDGGAILLGAREEDENVIFDGLTDEQIRDYQKDLWNCLNNRSKVSVNLLSARDILTVDIGGVHLLRINVPRASRSQRPVYLGPNPFGHTFRRCHEGDYRCSDDEVRRMLADADPVPADHRILEAFTLDDLDPASIGQYRQRFLAAKPDHPWLVLETRDLLERLGGWRRDRDTGREGLTVAGLLMFGKHTAILDTEAVPNYFVDYREKLDPSVRWTDRLYPDGTWEANLFQFYQRIWPRLVRDLKVPFSLEGWMRRDETPVHEALREALVNALIHTDYAAPGGIVIERYPDQFVLENPGTLLVSLEQLRRGGVSECRNKSLQQMFLMIGGGERAGSGFDKIQSGWRSQHWRAPLIKTQFRPDRVRLELPMISLISDEAIDALQVIFGDRFRTLSEAEVQALVTAHQEGEVTNARLQELLSDHPVEITRLLQGLCQRGFLVSDNRRRWTRYRLVGSEPNEARLSNDGVSRSLVGDSIHLPEDSTHIEGDSQHSGGYSPQPPADSLHPVYAEGADALKELESLAVSVSGRKRVPESEMRTTVARLCQGRYLTIEELARILGRNPNGLRERIVKPMVREGILRLRYPQSPNRPDQAYTACGNGENA